MHRPAATRLGVPTLWRRCVRNELIAPRRIVRRLKRFTRLHSAKASIRSIADNHVGRERHFATGRDCQRWVEVGQTARSPPIALGTQKQGAEWLMEVPAAKVVVRLRRQGWASDSMCNAYHSGTALCILGCSHQPSSSAPGGCEGGTGTEAMGGSAGPAPEAPFRAA
jgi:hypothetical protein